MRIHFLGNVCNYGYWMAKWCREIGVEAQLFMGDGSYARDMPWWDDPDLRDHSLPKWVKTVKLPMGKEFLPQSKRLKLYAEILDCDLIHSFSPDMAGGLLGLGKPHLYHSVGGFDRAPFYSRRNHDRERLFAPRPIIRAWRFRRMIRDADQVIIGQPYELAYALYFKPLGVTILPIPYQIPSPADVTGAPEKRFFAPARQYWWFKGNDLLLRAYGKLLNDNGEEIPPLVMLDWGPDTSASQELAHKLGISPHVRWEPVLVKETLLSEMTRPGTIVVDQFCRPIPDEASLGGIGRDALSVCAPLISHISIPAILKVNTSAPPILAVSRPTVEHILEQLRLSLSMSWEQLAALGRAGHEWLVAEHDWRTVMPRYLELYEKVIREKAQ